MDLCWPRSAWNRVVHHKPSELSIGQQQRVALARTLANDPAVILADEPTGNLDPETREQVLIVSGRAAARGAHGVMVTHDPAAASRATRVIKLRDGAVVSDSAATHCQRRRLARKSSDAADHSQRRVDSAASGVHNSIVARFAALFFCRRLIHAAFGLTLDMLSLAAVAAFCATGVLAWDWYAVRAAGSGRQPTVCRPRNLHEVPPAAVPLVARLRPRPGDGLSPPRRRCSATSTTRSSSTTA